MFGGIGGFRKGLEALDYECVFASEIDKYARQTYKANFGDEPHGDITKIEAKDIPDHDILTAGFPCQSFSIAGHRKGFNDTRGTLFFDIARILKVKKPQYFLLENVKGLISHGKGKTLQVILDTLQELGYGVDYKVLNTKDYGLPQNRQRIFLVGRLNANLFWKLAWPEPIPLTSCLKDYLHEYFDPKYICKPSEAKWISDPTRIKKRYTQIDGKIALCQQARQYANWNGDYVTVDPKYFLSEDQVINAKEKKSAKKKILKDGRTWSEGAMPFPDKIDKESRTIIKGQDGVNRATMLIKVGHFNKGGQGDRVYSPDGIAATLSANGGGRGAKTGLYEVEQIGYVGNPKSKRKDRQSNRIYNKDKLAPALATTTGGGYYEVKTRIRKLTPRECFRLQGFHEDYIIPVSDTQAWKQAGNAVSVPVITELGLAIKADNESTL